MQLSLFEEYRTDDEIIMDKANDLLDMLNEDFKESDKYLPQYHLQQNGIIVLIVANKNKDVLFNAIDSKGNIPEGFSANWRIAPHIKEEMNL